MAVSPKVAIVHDFLYTYAGAERVLEQVIAAFPDCDVFSLFDFLPDDQRDFLAGKKVKTTFIQRLPFARSRHRAYLPLMPLAIEQLDMSAYDIVISSSYVAAKGVITGPDQLHVCYCHSPCRFAWDLQHQYLDKSGVGYGPLGILKRLMLHYFRNWDSRTALGVDHFIANSEFVARRIQKVYRREATVIYPPVDLDAYYPAAIDGESFTSPEAPLASVNSSDGFYLTASRLVNYKKIDLIVRAFNEMPDRKLVVIGGGPELDHLRSIACRNVQVLGHQPAEVMADHMRRAKAFVFAAEEDFGIVPVEATRQRHAGDRLWKRWRDRVGV